MVCTTPWTMTKVPGGGNCRGRGRAGDRGVEGRVELSGKALDTGVVCS